MLEEIRQLTNLGQGEEQPVQIILVGQPELEATIDRPDLAQLKQRIRVHYKLAHLTRHELEEYVDHRMVVAGGRTGTFSARALDRIYEISGGVPRVVNTLAIEALLSAFVAGRHTVEGMDLDDQAPAVPVKGSPAAPVSTASVAEAPPMRPGSSTRANISTRADMAVRRDVAADPPRRAEGTAPVQARRGATRGRNLAIAAILFVGVVAVLAATGRLDPLWSRSPVAGTSDGTVQPRSPIGEPPLPVEANEVEVSASPVDSSLSLEPAAADTAATVTESRQTAAVPVITETPRREPDVMAKSAVRDSAISNAAAATAGEHYIHVSSFRTAAHAADVATQFTDRGLFATVRQQLVRDSMWYRVYLGPYGSHDSAVRLANRLREEGTITYYKVVLLGAEVGL
ncbi:MAG: SPOR domain-containing protein [Ahniella sp.]|nr:SPOR domain-containing protein [Ahniella sp.]